MEPVLWILLIVLLSPVLIGLGLVWKENRFYGKLPFQQKPDLDTFNHMGGFGQDHFRQALRELRIALDHDRPEDAAGWVRAARRRGWWLAETAAASEESKELGRALRKVTQHRAGVEDNAINIEDTGLAGNLEGHQRTGQKFDTFRTVGMQAWSQLTDDQRESIRDRAQHHHAWAVSEIVAVIGGHCQDPGLSRELTAAAQAPVTDKDLESWTDWEACLHHWALEKVPHSARVHPERPPLPAYAGAAARKKHLEAAEHQRRPSNASFPTTAPRLPAEPSAGRGAAVVEDRPTRGWDGRGTLARRREQARGLHLEMIRKVASYDLDFDLQLKYPQFHNRDIPEVRAMDGAARRASDEWDLIESVPQRGLTAADVAAYRDAVDAFKQAVLACDARVRLIGDAGISDAELRDLQTARGLFTHISDPANPEPLRNQYRARLVQVLRRIDSRPGSRVSFTPQGLLALESGKGETAGEERED